MRRQVVNTLKKVGDKAATKRKDMHQELMETSSAQFAVNISMPGFPWATSSFHINELHETFLLPVMPTRGYHHTQLCMCKQAIARAKNWGASSSEKSSLVFLHQLNIQITFSLCEINVELWLVFPAPTSSLDYTFATKQKLPCHHNKYWSTTQSHDSHPILALLWHSFATNTYWSTHRAIMTVIQSLALLSNSFGHNLTVIRRRTALGMILFCLLRERGLPRLG